MSKQYRIQNYILGKSEYFDTNDEAIFRIKELENEILINQSSRFSIIQTIENSNGVMWIAPSDNSEEDGDYMVFISKTGKYEKIKGRTAAYARNQELKDEFLTELAQTPEFIEEPIQPSTAGTQEL